MHSPINSYTTKEFTQQLLREYGKQVTEHRTPPQQIAQGTSEQHIMQLEIGSTVFVPPLVQDGQSPIGQDLVVSPTIHGSNAAPIVPMDHVFTVCVHPQNLPVLLTMVPLRLQCLRYPMLCPPGLSMVFSNQRS
ncbi:hypothetical protein MRB53_001790 [Persea americana]|uniref:Uncharacterized protein n=1 Tax=Persea americana TaxID=3435 RepID=A0ACC2MV06_PERAE|nr:hypothetical protein MRB53_001790 [Persea americana]